LRTACHAAGLALIRADGSFRLHHPRSSCFPNIEKRPKLRGRPTCAPPVPRRWKSEITHSASRAAAARIPRLETIKQLRPTMAMFGVHIELPSAPIMGQAFCRMSAWRNCRSLPDRRSSAGLLASRRILDLSVSAALAGQQYGQRGARPMRPRHDHSQARKPSSVAGRRSGGRSTEQRICASASTLAARPAQSDD